MTTLSEPDLPVPEAVPAGEPDARLPYPFARRNNIVLVTEAAGPVLCHTGPVTLPVLLEIQRSIGRNFSLRAVEPAELDQAITEAYQRDDGQAQRAADDIGADTDFTELLEEIPKAAELVDGEDDAPIIRLINAMLSQAIREHASDIHVELFEHNLTVRYRVDGVLREVLKPRREIASMLVSRLKVMARLDIAEKRVPQDGRISVTIAGHAVDIRVSTIPSAWGERVVLRLLDKQSAQLDVDDLGMDPPARDRFKCLLASPHGIILVTGPTGSGKTTTLYAGLTAINDPVRNILTIEDPIEYLLAGIGQTQVNPKVDMTFARGLRAILRQDPDVVMVGEIRDLETAQIAVQASLTGHLVLSTLHTNTAVGAITRLEDMGVERFLLAASLIAVISQRLVRVLCEHCKRERDADASEAAMLGVDEKTPCTLCEPVGCAHCAHTGYRGRQGIYELVEVDDALRQLIHDDAGESAMLAEARRRSLGMFERGAQAVLAGETSLAELLRVTKAR